MADRVALIRGGASGLGVATAKQRLQSGWKVAIVDRDEATLEPARKELGAAKGVLLAPLDVTDDDAAGRGVRSGRNARWDRWRGKLGRHSCRCAYARHAGR